MYSLKERVLGGLMAAIALIGYFADDLFGPDLFGFSSSRIGLIMIIGAIALFAKLNLTRMSS